VACCSSPLVVGRSRRECRSPELTQPIPPISGPPDGALGERPLPPWGSEDLGNTPSGQRWTVAPLCSGASLWLAFVPPILRIGAGYAVPVPFGKPRACRNNRKPEAHATMRRSRRDAPAFCQGLARPLTGTKYNGSVMNPSVAGPASARLPERKGRFGSWPMQASGYLEIRGGGCGTRSFASQNPRVDSATFKRAAHRLRSGNTDWFHLKLVHFSTHLIT
jgi:hypothetical protein